MLKKWFELIYDHKINLRERMFRVVTGICMIALTIILPMGRTPLNLLILAVSLGLISLIVRSVFEKNASMQEPPPLPSCFWCFSP